MPAVAFSTTYGAADAMPPDFSFGVIWHYVADMQFVLLVLAGAWTALILRLNRGNGITQTALVAAGNLLVNLAFFMSHPVFTPYYTVPVADAFVVEFAVCWLDAAGGSGGR